jgi:vacuolar-type H+-ATPase subunit E/Vma4
VSDASQVASLRQSILQRADALSQEHVNQGKMTRNRIMDDAREKVKLMEQKELLAAQENAERRYQRRVQASEIKLQKELDRNRWGLVQAVLDSVQQKVVAMADDHAAYERVFMALLKNGVEALGEARQVAQLNNRDRGVFADKWNKISARFDVELELSDEFCDCSGGLRLYSSDGNKLVDNTFEGLIERRQEALVRVIFERLFSKVPSMGVTTHG